MDRDGEIEPRPAAARDRDVGASHVGGAVGRRDVARTDHGREPQLPLALGQPGQPQIDDDARGQGLTGRQVGDRLREDVGALLPEQRRGIAPGDRALERIARVLGALHAPGDRAAPQREAIASDRAVGRQRHPVDSVERLGRRVLDSLLELEPGDAALRDALERHRHQRQQPAVGRDELRARRRCTHAIAGVAGDLGVGAFGALVADLARFREPVGARVDVAAARADVTARREPGPAVGARGIAVVAARWARAAVAARGIAMANLAVRSSPGKTVSIAHEQPPGPDGSDGNDDGMPYQCGDACVL